jgi:hypothetical protein
MELVSQYCLVYFYDTIIISCWKFSKKSSFWEEAFLQTL